ncbi:hypothetical protein T439DRAFT_287744 [Meredithblackwellia eburnea MCA 4105]
MYKIQTGTVNDHGIEDGDQLNLICGVKGGKPVIYLFPPTPIENVNVSISLVPEWSFTALYPVVPVTRTKTPTNGTNTRASWSVSASPDGNLFEHSSGLELSYLFWEALTNHLPPSPPLLPLDAQPFSASTSPAFNPATASLDPTNSLLLPFTQFIKYLDQTLQLLTLHTSARNDFINYWLPHFVRIRNRGQHIAFRFLDQEAYAQAAVLEVEPRPDVVTRVFLVFKGVREGEWEEEEEEKRLGIDVDWREVVGVKREAGDESRFRCLEWGGMEIR